MPARPHPPKKKQNLKAVGCRVWGLGFIRVSGFRAHLRFMSLGFTGTRRAPTRGFRKGRHGDTISVVGVVRTGFGLWDLGFRVQGFSGLL